MLRSLVRPLLVLVLCGFALPAKASVRLIVMFDHGVCALPAAQDSVSDLQSITLPNDIYAVLQTNGVSSVATAFPDFVAADTLVTTRSGDAVRVGDMSRVFYLECETEAQASSLTTALSELPGVVYVARPDEQIKLACDYSAVSDPYYNAQNGDGIIQWNLNNCGSPNYLGHVLTQDADMDIPEAWTITHGSDEKVFVFDNGVTAAGGYDLSGRSSGSAGYTFFDPTNWLHGTNMAAIIVGNQNNGVGGTGINWLAQVQSRIVKGYTYDEGGHEVPVDYVPALQSAVAAALASGSEIINMSYTNESPRTSTLEPELLALRDAYNAGFLLVSAAGNDGPLDPTPNPARWPAAYDFVMGVGSSNFEDGKWDFSSVGSWVDVVAPGQAILELAEGATWPASSYAVSTAGNTSASTAEVSGVASLLLAKDPTLGGEDLRRLIQHSTDNFTGGSWTPETGWGRVNAYKALKLLMPPNKFFRRSGIGGSSYATVVRSDQVFKDVAGVTSNQYYHVKRHELRRDVTYPVAYNAVPYVYGRGAGTNGFTGSNPEYGVEFCGVVSGSQTRYGCTLYTYVYEILNQFGATVGWIPKQPNEVQFSYSVVGLDRDPRITSYVRPQGSTVLTHMTTSVTRAAAGCPARDGAAIVIKVSLPAEDYPLPLSADAVTIAQPVHSNVAFYPDGSTIIADTAPQWDGSDPLYPGGCYKTTITITSFGGCGIDSAQVSVLGNGIGYALLNIHSPDILIDPALGPTRAKVSTADFSQFTVGYASPPKAYLPCSDYVWPSGGTSNLPDSISSTSDFSYFSFHYNHGDPAGGGHPTSLADGANSSSGHIRLDLGEEYFVGDDRVLPATVHLEGLEAFKVGMIAFKTDHSALAFRAWTPSANYDGTTMCTEVVRDGVRQVMLGVVGVKDNTAYDLELGKVEFTVQSDGALELNNDDLELILGDILTIDGHSLQVSPKNYGVESGPRVYKNELLQNHPNPFNPTTTVTYSLKGASHVTLTIYDVTGRRVRELVNEQRAPGVYKVAWDGANAKGSKVASGVYFYKLVAGSFTDTKKMIMLK